jgi:hypothetical protein
MIRPTPTAYRGLFTVHTDNREVLTELVSTLGPATLVIASPSLARMVTDLAGPPPPLPGGEFRDLLTAEAEAAGVPAAMNQIPSDLRRKINETTGDPR